MKDSEQLQEAIDALEGDYELIRQLGQGATSVVYLLRDHALDRKVAMKVIKGSFAGDEEALARLQREAKLVAQLTHPNIVKLFGTQRLSDGSFALFMEHVPGRNLKELLREEGAFSVPRTLEVLKDIGSALAYAHRRRIVHRDVKPENIYIDEEVGSARLADFGVARPWDQDARLTLPGASLGTPAYMSPEQIDGQEVDGRSDVYSLGLVGYELLLGHHPWEGENVFTIIYRQKNDDLPMEDLGLDDHPGLRETLKQALAKDPSERIDSAVGFLEHLTEAEQEAGGKGGPGLSRPVSSAHLDEDLGPVDWDTVEPRNAASRARAATGAATGAAAGAAGRAAPGEAVALENKEDDRPVLAAKPRNRLRYLWLSLVGVAVLAGAYGVFAWQPWSGSGGESEDLVPITTPPPEPAEDPATVATDATLDRTGLFPVHDSVLVGTVGSLIPLEVRAVSADGDPMTQTLVNFRVTDGNGILETEQAVTDQAGFAEASLRMPNRPGDVFVTAQVAGADSLRTILLTTATVGPPERMVSILGDGQRADPGETLDEAVGVRVLDEFGNAIPGVQVRFRTLQGGGRVSPAETSTDEEGRAFARWTLGNRPGTQLMAAVVPQAEDALLTFGATAVAPPPTRPEPAMPTTEEETPDVPAAEPVSVVTRTFAVGGTQVCHLVNGSAACRGANDRGQGGNTSFSGLVGLTAGVSHACGLDVTGGAWCWGANESGQLGDASTRDRSTPAAVDTEARFSLLAAGLAHTCGVRGGGQVSCWGRNVSGQLGIGSREDQGRPVALPGGRSYQDLVAGWNHTCGLRAGGQAYCWGSNSAGQIGDGTEIDRLSPTLVPGSFQALAAGASHTCGISGSEVLCWGDNDSGQLGDGTTEDRSTPAPVTGLPAAPRALTAGAVHTCAILTDRSVYCWGQNLHGQLGDGTNQNRTSPVPVAGDMEFVALYAGGGVTCGFSREGTEYCWGLNQSGQLGDGTRTNRSSPTPVGGT